MSLTLLQFSGNVWIDYMGKHIFQLGIDYMIQIIRDKRSVHSAKILGIGTAFASVLHAQITVHFGEMKFNSIKINTL